MSSRSARGTGDTLPLAAPGQVLEPGAVIGGRYRLLRWLGSGGMGAVYEVEDSALGAIVALKMTEGASWDAGTVAQLKREIMLARRVTHPNVCRVHDFGLHQLPDGRSTPFLTMELLRGETLASLLHREGRLTPDAALGVVRQLAAALDAAHSVGVVHRDFKTGNVMIAGERAVVTDFGLAVDTGDSGAASSGMLVGSPAYMAPEQVRGAHVTRSSDIYALGVVLYELLTGHLPFVGATSIEVATRRLLQPPTPLTQYLAHVDRRWERAILRCLDLDPSARWASGTELLRALGDDVVETAPRVPLRSDLPPSARAVALVLAEDVEVPRLLELASGAYAGTRLALEDGRVAVVLGADRSVGDEIDRALRIARLWQRACRKVAISIGRAWARGGQLGGEAREDAEAVLARITDGVGISSRTALALAGRCELEPIDDATFRVGPLRRPPAAAPLVGRDAERSMLRRARDAARDESRPVTSWIVGPPGSGKSRLLELAAELAREAGFTVRVARAASDERRALGPIASLAGVGTATPSTTDARATSTAALALREDPQALADRVQGAIVHELVSMADRGPLALLIDEAEAADAASLALLEVLPVHLADRSVWVVVAARDELAEAHPDLLTGLESAGRIEPSPLSAADVAELVRAQTGVVPSATTVQALRDRSAGNPLFVEQLAAMLSRELIESGAIDDWPLPATIEHAVQARLDRLPDAERVCLELLALYGTSATVSEIAELGLPTAKAQLAQLARRALVVRVAGEAAAYRVRSQLVADVAARMIEGSRRASLSARAAEVAERYGRDAEDIGRHLADAGDPSGASERYLRAVWAAVMRGDGRTVLRAGASAEALGVPRDVAFALCCARADAARFVGDPTLSRAMLEKAEQAARDDAERALVAVEQGEWLRRARHPDAALARLGDALALARAAGQLETEVRALALRAVALSALGRNDEAEAALDALEPLSSRCSPMARGMAMDLRGYLAAVRGDRGAQHTAYAAAAALYTEAGDLRRAAGATSNLADAAQRLGRRDEAEAGFRRALELARRLGNRLTEGYALLNLGNALSDVDRVDEALATLAQARAVAEVIGDPHLALGARLYLARTALLRGADPALLAEIEQLAIDAAGDATLVANAHALGSRAALRLGEVERALEHARRALDVRRSRGSIEEGEAELFAAAAAALDAAGLVREAEDVRRAGRERAEELAQHISDSHARARFLEAQRATE